MASLVFNDRVNSTPGSIRFLRRIRIGISGGLFAGALFLLPTPLTFCLGIGLFVHLAFSPQKRIAVFCDDEFLQVVDIIVGLLSNESARHSWFSRSSASTPISFRFAGKGGRTRSRSAIASRLRRLP